MTEQLVRRAAFLVTAAGVVLLIGAGWRPDIHPDADAYWLAANRLREGLPLYAASYLDEVEIYRYAPWFAYAWVPLTYLPQEVAYTIWRSVLLAGAIAAVLPIVRQRTPASLTLSLLIFGLLVSNLPAANVTGLIVGALSLALPSRAGPVVLGMAGSLKVFPLLFVAGYLAERRWRDAAVALGIASVLWLHALAFDVGSYPTAFGGISMYSVAPLLWPLAVVGVLGVLAYCVARGSRWSWLVAAAAIPVIVPRIWLPDAAYVIAAAAAVLASGRGWSSSAEPPNRKPLS